MKLNLSIFIIFLIILSLTISGCSKSTDDMNVDSDTNIIDAQNASKYNEQYNIRDGVKIISLSQLYSRNDASNCWVGIGVEVYDISDFIKTNPQLDLSKYCGTLSFEAVIDSYNLDLIEVQKMSLYVGNLNY